jgi:MPBQ/MSBQ methyltransferase
MAGPTQPVVFPLMWANDPSGSFLRTPAEMRALIARAGFVERAWDDVTEEAAAPATAEGVPAHSAQRLIMGDALDAILRANHRNRAEGRMVSVQALFERR